MRPMPTSDESSRPIHPVEAAPSREPHAIRTVLLVAAAPFFRDFMAIQLRRAGCFPMPVHSAHEGRRLAAEMVPDLIVLDLDSGAEVDAQWAARLARSPTGKRARLAMLTADPAQHCGPQGERCGADLCVTKPVEPRELVRDLLRLMRPPRAQPQRPRARPPLKGDGIELDREQPTVRLRLHDGWRTVDLPWTEHRLLAFLLSGADKAHSREAIRDAVWRDTPVDLRTVDQCIRRLRRSLDAAGARELVKTLSGVGYRLDLAVLKRGAA